MDTFEVLNNLLVKLFNDILDVEEKAIITDEFKDISVTDMHIIEAVGTEEPRTMTAISKTLGVTMGTLTIGMNALVKKGYIKTQKFKNSNNKAAYVYAVTPKGISARVKQTQYFLRVKIEEYERLKKEIDELKKENMYK